MWQVVGGEEGRPGVRKNAKHEPPTPESGVATTCHDWHFSANKNCCRMPGRVLSYSATMNCAIITNDKDDVLPLLR
jgi:hypothetical protein